VFTAGSAWSEFMAIDDGGVRIRTANDPASADFYLRFGAPGAAKPAPRHWKIAAELPPAPPDQPLAGLSIAIDPGHIGGAWAELEGRWLKANAGAAVCEGDMTLLVAKLLKPRLEARGATVSLVRQRNEPVTSFRPESLMDAARESNESAAASPAELEKIAGRLFYRTAEIRARAKRVNASIKPDLVLCLHFNAEPWGLATQPILVERSHFHLLLNGAYTDQEVALVDQRFCLLLKLLGRAHEEEALVATTVADVFAKACALPPYRYANEASNARSVNGNPYLWARNLLANRLYNCPVIFLEPYVMNSTVDFARLQAGDYDGIREINGKPQISIIREYADALTDGLAQHYAKHRKIAP
jgi:hypothetical protein